MKKINLIVVLVIAFALFVCVSGVVSATYLSPKYVGNTIVDLSWSQYWSGDFSKYVIYRDGSPIATIENRAVTFYRDSGLTKGVTYGYGIYVYNSTGWLVDSGTTSAKTGDVHGTITRDTTWTAASSPYVQTGPVTVQKGVHFTIQPGVKVDNAALYIYETINVKSVSFNGFVKIYNSNDSSIQDCSFDGNGIDATCLRLELCNGAKIIGNTASGSNWSGISISGGGNNILTDNIVNFNDWHGIALSDSSNNTLTSNTASNNGDGIKLYSSSNNALTNNNASNNDCGINLQDYSTNNSISNNNCSSNNGSGIIFRDSNNGIISNNNCFSNRDGIDLYYSNNNEITNNKCENNDGYGIILYYSNNNAISNNNCSNNFWGIHLLYSSNSILTNNSASYNYDGISLSSSNNSILTDNTANYNNCSGFSLQFSSNCALTDNSASYNYVGFHIVGSNNILTNNIASNDNSGFELGYPFCNNNIISNNSIYSNNEHGILLVFNPSSNTISNNNIFDTSGDGIALDSSDNNLISNNNIYSNDDGIWHYNSTSNTISNNSIYSNNEEGICLEVSTSNTISDNNIFDNNDQGIWLWDLNSNNIISNNSIYSNTEEGIGLDNSASNTISNNNIFDNNDQGIWLGYLSNNNIISNNSIHSNNEEGIGLDNSASNTISDNTISNNDYGIGLWDLSNNNLIYNNYFNNTNNAYDDGNNRWNTTKTAGTNIIGGAYLGGNYWSDYNGIDTDEDGLGDWLTPYSCSGEIENGGDYLPLTFLSLEPGDLLLCRSPKSIVPGFWTHAGMYVGGGEVVEALLKSGVTKTSVANWNAKTCVEALRVATTQGIRDKAVEFVKKQARENDSYYGLFWLTGRKHLDGNNWYCSELVWAAYKNQGVDIERYPDYVPLGDKGGILIGHNAVSPYEVHLSGNTYVIGEHKEKCPKRSFLFFFTKSPISLSVTDPDNFTINRELNEIPEAIYGCGDIDDDGDPDDWIGIPEQKIGNYLITVIPEPDAAPTDTYSLEVSTEDTTVVLAENVSVSEIPTEPYIFESKAMTFDTGSSANLYPSISGTHNGTIMPNQTITASKLYTYPCTGTGGHTEYAAVYYTNGTLIAEAHWNGYQGDWHNLTFNESFILRENETYNYTIRTGSYPQIIHESPFNATGGTITCDKFIGANGRIYYDWIPAIRLE